MTMLGFFAVHWLAAGQTTLPVQAILTGLVVAVVLVLYVRQRISDRRKGKRSRRYSVGLAAGVMALDEILKPTRKHVLEARHKLKEKKEHDDSGGPDDTSSDR